MTLHIPDGYTSVGILLTNDDSAHTAEVTIGTDYPGNTMPFAAFGGLVQGFIGTMIQDCTTNIHCSQVVLTQSDGAGGTGSTVIDLVDVQDGAATGDPMTPNVAYLYRKVTDRIGRKFRGRFYLPGVSEGHVDGGGSVASSFLLDQRNHMFSALEDWSTGAGGIPLVPVLFHSDPSLTPTPITEITPEPMVATQRRRLVR